jgi:hypothetical protein
MKIRKLILKKKSLPLTVLVNCSVGIKNVNKSNVSQNVLNHMKSNFYQTTKKTCYLIYKSMYISSKN